MPNKKVDKPWGQEIILTEPKLPYTAKIIHVSGGSRLSLQYHDQKTETLVLISGQANLVLGRDQKNLQTITMQPSLGYTVKPGDIHRITAITDSVIFEASTPEVGNTFRLEDDYQRSDETENIRNSQRQ